MKPKIRLISFDLDNTLWDVDKIILRAEQDMRAWMADNAPESLALYQSEQISELRKRVVRDHPEMVHDLTFMRLRVLEGVMARAGYNDAESRTLAQRAFDVFFEGRNRVEFFPGALETLRYLSEEFQLIALTNGNADIHRAGLSDYLSHAFSSADVGQSKPHRDMFETPLRRLKLNAPEAIHIGDNLVDDIAGANAVGMHSIWVNLSDRPLQSSDAQPSREVRSLEEIVGAVAEIAQN